MKSSGGTGCLPVLKRACTLPWACAGACRMSPARTALPPGPPLGLPIHHPRLRCPSASLATGSNDYNWLPASALKPFREDHPGEGQGANSSQRRGARQRWRREAPLRLANPPSTAAPLLRKRSAAATCALPPAAHTHQPAPSSLLVPASVLRLPQARRRQEQGAAKSD